MPNNFDRGMIKWAPFNSVISNKEIIRTIQKEKAKVKMPYLSDEQKENIEHLLLEAFYEKRNILIEYYYDGKIIKADGTIKKIDSTFHKIYFNNRCLIFEQILKIT